MVQVLIVDDERIIAKCLQEQIDWVKLGCAVPAVCYDGNQALRHIAQTQPDIVITDIRMPGMDGITLCRLLHEQYPSITVFILSAYEDFEVAQMALRYNVKDYILKPLDRKGLRNVEEMVSRTVAEKQKQRLCAALLSNIAQGQLEAILDTRDEASLEELLETIAQLERDPTAEDITLWMNLVMPAVCCRDAGQEKRRYLEEKQVFDRIRGLNFRERLHFVREKYADAMRGEPDSHSSSVVYAVQKTVDTEFASTELSVAGLAAQYNMSASYLGSLFTQVTGVGLAEYIREKRLSYACDQLRTGSKSISLVAQESGFSNVNYFTKVFRKNIGIPPAEYRNRYRERH